MRATIVIASMMLISAAATAAEPEGFGIDEQVLLFDYQQAGAVARGTVRFIEDHEPADEVGIYGGTMEVEFTPVVVLKGSLAPMTSYRVDIPNRFLSFRSTYMSRDQAYLQRQELLEERLQLFSAGFVRATEAHDQGEMSDEEFSHFNELAGSVAREISSRKKMTIHTSPSRPVEETPVQRLVFDGSVYTLFLTPPTERGNKFMLSTRDRSIFGGLENFHVQRLIENGIADP